MHRREALNLATVIPLFMVLVERLGYDGELDRALRVVDSYLMRRVVLNTQNRSFDDAVFGLVHSICDASGGEEVSILIQSFENATWANRWPNDGDIEEHLVTADMYNHISSTKKQLILQGIAKRMHEENERHLTMKFNPAEALHVEHVAPGNWEKHWKEELEFGDTNEERERLNKLVNLVGNLTIVTQAMNNQLLDNPWTFKKKLLEKDNLEMNRRLIADMNGDIWNEEEILNRCKDLSGYVISIWPHAEILREELDVEPRDSDSIEFVAGISKNDFEHVIDSVIELGVEEGWIHEDGISRQLHNNSYGREFLLRCDNVFNKVWLCINIQEKHVVLSFQDIDGIGDEFVEMPIQTDTDELVELLTGKVQAFSALVID